MDDPMAVLDSIEKEADSWIEVQRGHPWPDAPHEKRREGTPGSVRKFYRLL